MSSRPLRRPLLSLLAAMALCASAGLFAASVARASWTLGAANHSAAPARLTGDSSDGEGAVNHDGGGGSSEGDRSGDGQHSSAAPSNGEGEGDRNSGGDSGKARPEQADGEGHQSVARSAPAHPPSGAIRPQTAPAPRVVVDTADPAPFAPTIADTNVSANLSPQEALGPLSGLSLGGGLVIWPALLAVDLIALGGIARLVVRRRLLPVDD